MAEYKNRILLDMVHFMITQSNLLISFLRDVLLTAAYILNCVPSKSIPSTPDELWVGDKPILDIYGHGV